MLSGIYPIFDVFDCLPLNETNFSLSSSGRLPLSMVAPTAAEPILLFSTQQLDSIWRFAGGGMPVNFCVLLIAVAFDRDVHLSARK